MQMNSRLHRAGLAIEAIVCFGPSFAYLLAGIVLLPHQFMLAAGHGVYESWIPVLYFLGAACLFFAVWRLFGELGWQSSPTLQPRTTLVFLALGAPVLFLGPVGMFALGRYEHIDGWLFIIFVALPIAGVVHLVIAARHWLFGGPTSRSTRSRAKTRAPG
jgi:hypothetical protein